MRRHCCGVCDQANAYALAIGPKVWEETPGYGERPFMEALWAALDEAIGLTECDIYSYKSDGENDPFGEITACANSSILLAIRMLFGEFIPSILHEISSCKSAFDVCVSPPICLLSTADALQVKLETSGLSTTSCTIASRSECCTFLVTACPRVLQLTTTTATTPTSPKTAKIHLPATAWPPIWNYECEWPHPYWDQCLQPNCTTLLGETHRSHTNLGQLSTPAPPPWHLSQPPPTVRHVPGVSLSTSLRELLGRCRKLHPQPSSRLSRRQAYPNGQDAQLSCPYPYCDTSTCKEVRAANIGVKLVIPSITLGRPPACI